MKKTIAALALTAASSPAFALMAPVKATKILCLDAYENAQGAQVAGTCDQSANNAELGRAILTNGCAEDQIALSARDRKSVV